MESALQFAAVFHTMCNWNSLLQAVWMAIILEAYREGTGEIDGGKVHHRLLILKLLYYAHDS